MLRIRVRRKSIPGVPTVFGPGHGDKPTSSYDRLLARQKGVVILLPGAFELRIGWGRPHPRSHLRSSESLLV